MLGLINTSDLTNYPNINVKTNEIQHNREQTRPPVSGYDIFS